MTKPSEQVYYCLIHRLKFETDTDKSLHTEICKMLILTVSKRDEKVFDLLTNPSVVNLTK